MAERAQDGEFGMELFALLLGHFHIIDFFAAEYL
jgi:hypothetical protein